jgi:antitoxin component YwqK of YwqJK toxin-antitoxin module
MMKQVYLVIFSFCVLLASCQSPKKEEKKNEALDSSAVAAQSAINKMVDEMAPPDSNYSGDFFLKYDNGLMKVKGFFRFGKRHGQWFYYYPNGYLWSDGFFENGQMNGGTKVYHENGKMYYEGAYKLDKAVGTWNFYDTSGAPIHVRVYDSLGKVVSDKDIPLPEPQKK